MMTPVIEIPRVDPSDPNSAIDYAALGSELEHAMHPGTLAAFAKRFGASTDGAMRSLATFALFMSKARQARLDGHIADAHMQERNAETVYRTDILEANRW
jgi:hypothetical protein